MKARKKAGVIEVQQMRINEIQSWPPHVKFASSSGDVPEPSVWNEPQQTWVRVNDGDYIRVDLVGDVYPIAQDYFNENFDIIEP